MEAGADETCAGVVPRGVLLLLRDLTDALTSGFDSRDVAALLLQGCIDHTRASEAGIMLADSAGGLRVFATSSDAAKTLELFEVQSQTGPCIDAYRTGHPVSCVDLSGETRRWPRFVPRALEAGFAEVHAVPIRIRDMTVGALNLFVRPDTRLTRDDLDLAQVLAGAAALGILTHRRLGEQRHLAEQLQRALNSRVVIEQAKGMIAAQTGATIGEAFEAMRAQARSERRGLRLVAEEIVTGVRPVPS